MSGDYFDGVEFRISSVIDEIEGVIARNDDTAVDQYGDRLGHGYSPETIERFRQGIEILRQAEIFTRRINYLLSCDDSEQSFHERLDEQLRELNG